MGAGNEAATGGERAAATPRPAAHTQRAHGQPITGAGQVRLAGESVLATLRESFEQWNAPHARLERRKQRASSLLWFWVVLTLLCSVGVPAAGVGEVMPAMFTAIAGVVMFGTLAVRSGIRVHALTRQTRELGQAPPARPALPAGSLAIAPVERLRGAESSLAELLHQLEGGMGAGPGAAAAGQQAPGGFRVSEVRATAGEASRSLRVLATKIATIERARESAPHTDRAALDEALGRLARQLDDGVGGYGSLVVAAGQAVAATGTGDDGSGAELADATDRLAGLAIALRELG